MRDSGKEGETEVERGHKRDNKRSSLPNTKITETLKGGGRGTSAVIIGRAAASGTAHAHTHARLSPPPLSRLLPSGTPHEISHLNSNSRNSHLLVI